MKKILLSICLAAAACSAFSQSASFGVKGGVNLSKLQESSNGSSSSITTGSLTSFSAGVFADFNLGAISIQPGVYYTGKGGKNDMSFSDNGNTFTANEKIQLYYLQVPVDVLYHVPVTAGNIFFGAGPFAAIGISGKIKSTTTITSPGNNSSTSVNSDVKFGNNSDSDVKSTDYGVNGLAGVKFNNGLLFSISYDLGLANINPGNTGDKIKTRVVGLSVGFAF